MLLVVIWREGNSNPFQYSCLENSMDREAWRAIVHGVARVRHDRATNTQTEKEAASGRRATEGFSEEVILSWVVIIG